MDKTVPKTAPTESTFVLKSSAFKDQGVIPAKYTCDGDDVSPLLEIRGAPAGTASFSLIMHDPDAPAVGGWDHWLIWNIDPRTQYISEDSMPDNAVQGKASGGRAKYSGPCPPRGSAPHHYNFTLYALDATLELAAGADKATLTKVMEGHMLGTATLTGLYQRP